MHGSLRSIVGRVERLVDIELAARELLEQIAVSDAAEGVGDRTPEENAAIANLEKAVIGVSTRKVSQ
ncbi:MAG: hypothetical protein CMK32_09600 [Porticoccaceae bacterium]|nr:hypothetical protein [Porticoccaceae bacterium]